ncbi:dual specificity protein phosphatase family protein [Nocardioides caldifontis]|uniref:dual specificity protein phosphatase family protein n=1 Tax=Nocardioides caldifontis TaxID=2588938 RepID=UPI001396C64E|nr:dual specificity protein phosphatase [Nocardioides caldifontis]
MTDPEDWRGWRPNPDEPLAPFRRANASFVTPYLAVGGDLDTLAHDVAVGQLDELRSAGISHVIDVRVEWSDEEWVRERHADVEYLHLGIDDAGQRVPDEWFDTGVSFAREAVESGGVVLAHCHMGINRGPSMGFAILLASGWDAREALDAIHAARPIAFVAYAEDALRWHHGDGSSDLAADLERVRQWRQDNDLDLGRVLRAMRQYP